ncbi:unnamed protein product, partial [Sphacelaria rigidula]
WDVHSLSASPGLFGMMRHSSLWLVVPSEPSRQKLDIFSAFRARARVAPDNIHPLSPLPLALIPYRQSRENHNHDPRGSITRADPHILPTSIVATRERDLRKWTAAGLRAGEIIKLLEG